MSAKRKAKTALNVIDLFSGAGGLSLGIARAGFSVCGAVELDPHAMAAHKRNFPKTKHLSVDIATLSGTNLISKFCDGEELAGVVGGPPCQGFSYIGKNDKDDPRNDLFVRFFRIVSEARPKFYLAENVPGILGKKHESLRKKAFRYVEDEYTVLSPMAFSAKDYGAPTVRTRVFFVGYRKDAFDELKKEDFDPPKNVQEVTVGTALKGLPIKITPRAGRNGDAWRAVRAPGKGYYERRLHGLIPNGVGNREAIRKLKEERKVSGFVGTDHTSDVLKRFAKVESGKSDPISKCRRLAGKGFCPTLRAGTGSDRGSYQAIRPIHHKENRVITPREAARLQGFPDWFTFDSTKWHSFRQIGNSVSPILAERIFSVILKAMR